MRHIYQQNKNKIGKVDDVFGPMSKPGIAIQPDEGVKAESFKAGDLVYTNFIINFNRYMQTPSNVEKLPSFFPNPMLRKDQRQWDSKAKWQESKDSKEVIEVEEEEVSEEATSEEVISEEIEVVILEEAEVEEEDIEIFN